jgi:hypothetical protein
MQKASKLVEDVVAHCATVTGRFETVEQCKAREARTFADANGISLDHARELIELAELQNLPNPGDGKTDRSVREARWLLAPVAAIGCAVALFGLASAQLVTLPPPEQTAIRQ